MHISTIATLVILCSASAAMAANDGPWCYRDFGGPQYSNCSFYSARQCLIVAGTIGGICERNHRPLPQPRKDKRRPS